jgi:hypothetical protein
MGLPDEPFHVPDDVLAMYRRRRRRGGASVHDWEQRCARGARRREAEWEA